MKVKWTALVEEVSGGVDARHYARHIPGNGEEAAICQKPELSKKTKKKKAAHPTCKRFSENIAISKEILHNPERSDRQIFEVCREQHQQQPLLCRSG